MGKNQLLYIDERIEVIYNLYRKYYQQGGIYRWALKEVLYTLS